MSRRSSTGTATGWASYLEVAQGTDPLDGDSDDDGLSDGDEADLGTDG